MLYFEVLSVLLDNSSSNLKFLVFIPVCRQCSGTPNCSELSKSYWSVSWINSYAGICDVIRNCVCLWVIAQWMSACCHNKQMLGSPASFSLGEFGATCLLTWFVWLPALINNYYRSPAGHLKNTNFCIFSFHLCMHEQHTHTFICEPSFLGMSGWLPNWEVT